MSDNFLGNPFKSWVKNQVNVRQKSLGKFSNIPLKDIQSYSTSTPFLRLASSVNLTNKGPQGVELENSVLKKLSDSFDSELISGDALAKNFILQGGVVSSTSPDSFSGLQSGLNNGSSPFNGAYGWGGTAERGYVPMPGITAANVEYQNNGALSKTTITVRCFSKAQFQLLDVLYLRPGYTLLLEFGHTQYLNNEESLVNMNQFYSTPLSLLLNPNAESPTSQYDIWKAIEDERFEHKGNYEAVYGKISKFSWQFAPDGSYDCTIQITGMGDVIESLKTNITNPGTPVDINMDKSWYESNRDPDKTPPLIANANSSIINFELYDIYQKIQKVETNGWANYTVKGFRGDKGEAPKELTIKNALYSLKAETDFEDEDGPQVYIKYGAFLAWLQTNIFPYNSKTKTLAFSFDMNFDDIDQDENVMLKVGGEFSSDPTTCLIPYENVSIYKPEEGITFPMPTSKINDEISVNSKWNYSTYLGRISNILVNINYIAKTFKTLSDSTEDGNFTAISFLKGINQGIMKSLGGINSLTVKLSDDQQKIRFIENIPQRRDDNISTGEFARFNVFGVKKGNDGSFITDIKLTADLSNNFASMISIGSQANANSISANATSFSNYSAGLVDRIIEEKLTPYPKKDETTDQPQNPKQTLLKNFTENINGSTPLFTSIYGENPKFLNENITSLTQHNKTHASLITGILTTEGQIQAPFFLPFNLSLEMRGLSGMVIYQKFLITDDILPPSYEKDGVDLQITGINHKIDTKSWTTSLSTQSTPADRLSSIRRPQQLSSTSSGQVASSQGVIGTTGNTEDTPNTDRLRLVISSLGYIEKGTELSNGGDITSATADMGIAVAKKVKEVIPSVTLRFTGGNDRYHQKLSYNSRHKKGTGLDVVVQPATPLNIASVLKVLQGFAAGNQPNFKFINEYASPTKAATSKHFHFSWGVGTEGSRDLNKSIALVNAGKIPKYLV